jgi:hypothetical protein
VQELLDEEDLSDVDEPILTSDHDTYSELSILRFVKVTPWKVLCQMKTIF